MRIHATRSDQQGAASRTQRTRHFCDAGGGGSPEVPEPWSSGSGRRPCTEHNTLRKIRAKEGAPPARQAAASGVDSHLVSSSSFSPSWLSWSSSRFFCTSTPAGSGRPSLTRAWALVNCRVPRRLKGRGLDFPRPDRQILLDPLSSTLFLFDANLLHPSASRSRERGRARSTAREQKILHCRHSRAQGTSCRDGV